nr:hypothetical protein [Rhodococcus sp. AW25M09]
MVKRLHAAAYVLRVPWEREDCTAAAIRFATAGGISGSTANDLSRSDNGGHRKRSAWSGVHICIQAQVTDMFAEQNCAELAF